MIFGHSQDVLPHFRLRDAPIHFYSIAKKHRSPHMLTKIIPQNLVLLFHSSHMSAQFPNLSDVRTQFMHRFTFVQLIYSKPNAPYKFMQTQSFGIEACGGVALDRSVVCHEMRDSTVTRVELANYKS